MTDYLWPHLTSLPYFRGFLRAIEARLLERIRLEPPRLDVGCGDGHFGSVAFSTPTDVGMDADVKSLKEAGRRSAYRILVAGDGGRMPFASRSFASAVSNSVLEHIPDVRSVLAEVARLVRPKGRFVFTVPNPGYLEHLSLPDAMARLGAARLGQRYEEWFRRITRVQHLVWEEEWAGWLEAAGFEVERSLRYFPPRAMRALEWGHYLGLPSLISRRLAGRWILAPTRWNLWLTARALRPYYDSPVAGDGAFTLYVARRG
ncbi:MAG TPA: class I SAM-dependent methyltransferase [Anaerolineales bacterium]|nr:class I SAM-dependent methyltransferase [Anaerolineales bacterium]